MYINTIHGEVLELCEARKNFTWGNLACHCGCGTAYITDASLDKLQVLRDTVRVPLYINSAARCPIHNASVGGAPLSEHRSTLLSPSTAYDISLHTIPKDELIDAMGIVGFMGIGINYKTFVHGDDRATYARW
jgi:hypothetical protein